jgi:hypothetical protein
MPFYLTYSLSIINAFSSRSECREEFYQINDYQALTRNTPARKNPSPEGRVWVRSGEGGMVGAITDDALV